jgi:hypothetical protein
MRVYLDRSAGLAKTYIVYGVHEENTIFFLSRSGLQ